LSNSSNSLFFYSFFDSYCFFSINKGKILIYCVWFIQKLTFFLFSFFNFRFCFLLFFLLWLLLFLFRFFLITVEYQALSLFLFKNLSIMKWLPYVHHFSLL
jgi:hypothetical protein